MNFDLRLKKGFPLIVCSMIAVVAYFQASGIAQLLASVIGNQTPISVVSRRLPISQHTRKNADSILKRNPFDSITGPLDGQTPAPIHDAPDPVSSGTGSNADPTCTFGRVSLIAALENANRSMAIVSDTTENKAQLRRLGDTIGEYTLETMQWDRLWWHNGAQRCQMLAFDKNAPKSARMPRIPKKKPKKRRKGRKKNLLAPELAAKIHKISDTQFTIERSVVDEILNQQAKLMGSIRLRPVKAGDKVSGLRLGRVRSGTLMDVLGLRNGDELRTINGFELTNPQAALEAYGRLRTADRLGLTLLRGGKPITVEFRIQ